MTMRLRNWLCWLLPVIGIVHSSAIAREGDVRSSRGSSRTSVPPIVIEINTQIRQHWSDFAITPSRPASDNEWCRRVFLDLLGRIPTVTELDEFERSPTKGNERRTQLVQLLLQDDRYTQDYARNWSTIWTNLLIGRSGGNENNSLTNREGMQKYLRDAFAQNRPYDRMVLELLTAEGNSKPGSEKFNGAVNFLVMKLADDATLATAETSRIFLGKQVQCTQCHDHPFNDWKQNQFWELNAFFRQTVPLRRFADDRMVDHVELADQDFAGEGGNPQEAEIYYELRNGKLESAYPVFIDGQAIDNKSGLLREVQRRKELARFVVGSDDLSRAIVNRLWGHFLGYGFTTPVDDLGPHNPPTHPELLERLAQEFAKRSFDLKQLMSWIVLSEPYSLSSIPSKPSTSESVVVDDPSLGEKPKFSRFYLRQMRAEELYESLLIATAVDQNQGSLEQREQTKRDWLRQFSVTFGNDEGKESSIFDGTITQTLMLFNGDLVKQALSDQPSGMLNRLASSPDPIPKKVDYLFRAAVSRNATKRELDAAQQLVASRSGNVLEGLQDVWWAILNSNEFILNR